MHAKHWQHFKDETLRRSFRNFALCAPAAPLVCKIGGNGKKFFFNILFFVKRRKFCRHFETTFTLQFCVCCFVYTLYNF